jgi:hypothetical protein
LPSEHCITSKSCCIQECVRRYCCGRELGGPQQQHPWHHLPPPRTHDQVFHDTDFCVQLSSLHVFVQLSSCIFIIKKSSYRLSDLLSLLNYSPLCSGMNSSVLIWQAHARLFRSSTAQHESFLSLVAALTPCQSGWRASSDASRPSARSSTPYTPPSFPVAQLPISTYMSTQHNSNCPLTIAPIIQVTQHPFFPPAQAI